MRPCMMQCHVHKAAVLNVQTCHLRIIVVAVGNLKSFLDPELEAKAALSDSVKEDIVLAGRLRGSG